MAEELGPPVELWLADEAATERFGERLGGLLRAGQGLALTGELGAGKTCVARGVARGLGVEEPDEVCSPTYLLVIEHPGRVPMVHVDAYLDSKTRGFLLDGGIDYLAALDGVVVVEWADRIADLLPPATLWVALERQGDGRVARLRPAAGQADMFPWLDGMGAS